jgi:hypothetical protein
MTVTQLRGAGAAALAAGSIRINLQRGEAYFDAAEAVGEALPAGRRVAALALPVPEGAELVARVSVRRNDPLIPIYATATPGAESDST